jgi:hypothetical protein
MVEIWFGNVNFFLNISHKQNGSTMYHLKSILDINGRSENGFQNLCFITEQHYIDC